MALMNRTIAILARAKYSTSTFTNASTTADVYRKDRKYLAQNYHPLPVAICRGKGNLNQLMVEDVKKKAMLTFQESICGIWKGNGIGTSSAATLLLITVIAILG